MDETRIVPSGKQEFTKVMVASVAAYYTQKLVEKIYDELIVQGKIKPVFKRIRSALPF